MSLHIQKNVPLAQYTTFKIGGPAKFFVEAKTKEDVIEAVKFAKKNDLEIFVLAGGSNVLVSDKGFDGLVIRIKDVSIKIQDNIVECGAGANFCEVVLKSVRNSLVGLEWAIGVPGNIGGAVRGNAGCFGGEISASVREVRAIDMNSLEIRTFSNDECDFSYRTSFFKKNNNMIVLSVILELAKGDQLESRKAIKDIVRKRNAAQPKSPSAGSFFKNPEVTSAELIEKFEADTGNEVKNGIIPAAWIIEGLGLKGKKIGGAEISKKHTNFIINSGQASAEDVIILSSIVKQKARERFGVQLYEEIQLVGF